MKTFIQVDNKRRLKDLVLQFGKVIKDNSNHKKIVLHLSGGLDTRSIFSVLLNLNKDFCCVVSDFNTTYTSDINIAKRLSKDYCKKLIFHKFKKQDIFINGFFELCNYTKDFDIVFSGLMMTEYLNRFQPKARYCFKKYQDDTLLYLHTPIYSIVPSNVFLPILDYELLRQLRYLYKGFQKNSIIQKAIINYYYPELLDYSYRSEL